MGAPSLRLAAWLLATAVISGCGDARGPSASYPVAAQGLFAGALSETADLALVGSVNHGGSLWRTAEQARLFGWNHRPGEFSPLVAAGFSPDGSRAVTADPRTLVIWDTGTGESLAYWTTPGTALDVALAPDGRRVLLGLEDHTAVLFDAETGAHLSTLLHRGAVNAVALSADGRWALTGSDDFTATLWNAATGDRVHTLEHDNPVRAVALSAEGRYAFTAARSSFVGVWNGASGERLLTISERDPGVTSARFSADERHLLVGYFNRAVELWDLAAGRRLDRWEFGARRSRDPRSGVLAVAFGAAPGRYYALAGDGRLLELHGS